MPPLGPGISFLFPVLIFDASRVIGIKAINKKPWGCDAAIH
jgi:hypothetical protein